MKARVRKDEKVEVDIVAAMRERISTHAIPPGSKISEAHLAEEFGVSRTRVREALTELEFRGLIKRIPNRGAEVIRLDLTQVFEIYDAREALEGMAVRLATQKAPPETWQEWVELLREGGPMEKLLEKGDVEGYFLVYERMRRRIIEAAENPVLAGMLDSILEKTRVIMRRVQILPGRAAAGLAEHRAFINAMRTGDAERAEQLRRANIRSAIATLKRYQNFIL
ncbi:MAG: GntR family transcriptional regulator [Gemmatimonadaceae bacterium]|nr:GntR family transcriptional regulator [Gemmatimonadaceae bacterium]